MEIDISSLFNDDEIMIWSVLVSILMFLILLQSLIKKYIKKKMIKKYGSYNGKLIVERKVAIGMNQKMVIDSWGNPSDINKNIYSFGVHEQWVYGTGNYVYFKDGVVSSISTRR